jgi:hypothetical protein
MKTGYKGACVQVYLDEKGFIELTKVAEQAGFRRGGLFLKVQRKGKLGLKEPSWNTKGCAKTLKYTLKKYIEGEAERLAKASELLKEQDKIKKELEKVGVTKGVRG